MADSRISNLNAVVTPALTDVYPVVQGGETKKIQFDQMVELIPVELIVACSDETTDLAVTKPAVTFRMPYNMKLTEVRASVGTAPTGSTIIVDINQEGVTIFSTKLTIDASEKTSTTASVAAVISDDDLADDAEITIDIDQEGSTIAGAGLKVTLIGNRILPLVS
jgi:hypothetical protein